MKELFVGLVLVLSCVGVDAQVTSTPAGLQAYLPPGATTYMVGDQLHITVDKWDFVSNSKFQLIEMSGTDDTGKVRSIRFRWSRDDGTPTEAPVAFREDNGPWQSMADYACSHTAELADFNTKFKTGIDALNTCEKLKAQQK